VLSLELARRAQRINASDAVRVFYVRKSPSKTVTTLPLGLPWPVA